MLHGMHIEISIQPSILSCFYTASQIKRYSHLGGRSFPPDAAASAAVRSLTSFSSASRARPMLDLLPELDEMLTLFSISLVRSALRRRGAIMADAASPLDDAPPPRRDDRDGVDAPEDPARPPLTGMPASRMIWLATSAERPLRGLVCPAPSVRDRLPPRRELPPVLPLPAPVDAEPVERLPTLAPEPLPEPPGWCGSSSTATERMIWSCRSRSCRRSSLLLKSFMVGCV